MQKLKLQFKIKNFLVIVFCGAGFIFWGIGKAQAAVFAFNSNQEVVASGAEVRVDLFLNTENEEINAVEGQLVLPADFLEIKEILDGNSVISFWVERPRLENNLVKFSGIVPGGISGPNELLFSLVLKTKETGEAFLRLENFKVLKNDGLGTLVRTTALAYNIKIVAEPAAAGGTKKAITEKIYSGSETEDLVPPEDFSPQIARDAKIFNGQWFLAFSTTDKGSGIDHFEVKEVRHQSLAAINSFEKAENPYLIKDQSLKSYLYVKAVDKKGNERLEILPPPNSAWYEGFWFYGIIIIVFLILFLLGKKSWKKKR